MVCIFLGLSLSTWYNNKIGRLILLPHPVVVIPTPSPCFPPLRRVLHRIVAFFTPLPCFPPIQHVGIGILTPSRLSTRRCWVLIPFVFSLPRATEAGPHPSREGKGSRWACAFLSSWWDRAVVPVGFRGVSWDGD